MKQEIFDNLARLQYEDEKRHIKKLKALLNDKVFPAGPKKRETHLMMLKYHKERLAYHKRMVPMKAVVCEEDLTVFMCTYYNCPSCGAEARLYKNYCEECGQRLMWE